MSVLRLRSLALVLCVVMACAGCGGGDSITAPRPVSTPTPAPTPTTTTLRQNSITGLDPDFVLVVPFTTTVAGDLEALVDWTFATNDLDLYLTRGTNPCKNDDQLIDFDSCTILLAENGTNKPERLRGPGLATGTYTLYVHNVGPGSESLSYQILLTYTPALGVGGTRLSALRPLPITYARRVSKAGK